MGVDVSTEHDVPLWKISGLFCLRVKELTISRLERKWHWVSDLKMMFVFENYNLHLIYFTYYVIYVHIYVLVSQIPSTGNTHGGPR